MSIITHLIEFYSKYCFITPTMCVLFIQLPSVSFSVTTINRQQFYVVNVRVCQFTKGLINLT